MTRICVPIFISSGSDLEETIAAAEDALRGTDGMIELRCDTASPKQMLEAIDLATLPVIVTVRPESEGGHSDQSDAQRLALWEQALEAGADYIDVELATWEKSKPVRDALEDALPKSGARLILSNHCFDNHPADLHERLKRLRAVKAAAILKLAWKAESIHDAIDALRLTARLPIANDQLPKDSRPVLALAMGEEGLISRSWPKSSTPP